MPTVQHPRGTRSAFNALVASNALLPGQLYVINDEQRIAMAFSPNSFRMFARTDEIGPGGGGGEVNPNKNPVFAYTDGRLTGITYDNGNTKAFAYNPDGTVDTITLLNSATSTYTVKKLNYADGVLTSIAETLA